VLSQVTSRSSADPSLYTHRSRTTILYGTKYCTNQICPPFHLTTSAAL
jgi:hypothetical protein